MTKITKPLILAALLSAFVSAPLSAQPLTLSQAQSSAGELVAQSRTAHLTCSAWPRALDCVVEGRHRAVRIAGDGFVVYYPNESDKVELLAPGISHDYDVYYEFDRSAFDALLKGGSSSLPGALVEKVERTEPRSVPASCVLSAKARPGDYYSFTGEFDRATKALSTSRGQGPSPRIDVSQGSPVDERCGSTAAPLEYSLNYYVTPRHYWGEDIFQLPKAALDFGAVPFQANLHLCQYDGDWHSSEDVALLCALER